jgi:transglutaminase-like putative cysteine protease
MYQEPAYTHGQFKGLRALRGNYQSQTPVQGFTISPGDVGIRQTCDFIRKQIDLGKADPLVQATFRQIAAESYVKDKIELSKALTHWVVQNIRYTPDDAMSMTEEGLKWIDIKQCPIAYKQCEAVEMIVTPHQILQSKQGDCDDLCMILGSFLELGGMPVRMVTIAADSSDPSQFSHVYLIANINGTWIPIDAVNHNNPWNWEAPNYYRKEIMC